MRNNDMSQAYQEKKQSNEEDTKNSTYNMCFSWHNSNSGSMNNNRTEKAQAKPVQAKPVQAKPEQKQPSVADIIKDKITNNDYSSKIGF